MRKVSSPGGTPSLPLRAVSAAQQINRKIPGSPFSSEFRLLFFALVLSVIRGIQRGRQTWRICCGLLLAPLLSEGRG